MHRIPLAHTGLVLFLAAVSPARGDNLPTAILTDLKNATVFIQVDSGQDTQSGSGFLIRVDGETGYVVTNHHVITVEPSPPLALPGRTRRPLRPVVRAPVAAGSAAITLVFNSGAKNERSAKAVVVADAPDDDLAVLKVAPLADLPKPIDLSASPELVETMPVYALGFPFGALLSVEKNSRPAITVSRAAVSSIRTNKQGELAVVQLDSTLSPGNSGGPIVDEKGKLVGVAVARIRDSSISLAVPAAELRRLLLGRLGGMAKFAFRPAEGGGGTVAVEVTLADPFNKLKTIAWHYRPASAGKVTEAPDGLAALTAGQRVEMRRDGSRATCEFTLSAAEAKAEIQMQGEYVAGDGKKSFTPPKTYPARANPTVVRTPTNPGTPGPTPGKVTPPMATLTANDLEKLLIDLKSSEGPTRQMALSRLARSKPLDERKAEVAAAVEPLLKVTEEFMAAEAARVLARWGTAENIPALLTALESQSVMVRWGVLDAIGYFPDNRTAEATAKHLVAAQDRRHASKALQMMGPKAEAAVAPSLTNKDVGVRLAACRVLKAIGTKASADALKQAASDSNTAVARAAEEALQAVSGR